MTKLEVLEQRQKKIVAQIKEIKQKQLIEDRKNRTHNLITLGGIVAKAKLDKLEKEVLLGLLLEAAKNLKENEEQWREIGSKAYTAKAKGKSDG